MATVKVYDQNKQECGELTLSADVFEVEARPEILNLVVRALAMKMALSSRLAAENLLVVKGIELPEAKTKHFAKVAGTLGLNKALIVTAEESEALTRSARNIPGITLTTPDRLSVLEILRHKQLVLLEGAVAPVQARFEK